MCKNIVWRLLNIYLAHTFDHTQWLSFCLLLPFFLSGDSTASPIVLCGPHGLKFERPVELRLPHSIASANKQESPIPATQHRHLPATSTSKSKKSPTHRSLFRPTRFRTSFTKPFSKFNSTSSLVSSPTSYYSANILQNNPFADAFSVNSTNANTGFLNQSFSSYDNHAFTSYSSLSSSPTPNPAWALALKATGDDYVDPIWDTEPQLEYAAHSNSFEDEVSDHKEQNQSGTISVMVDHF